MSTDMWSVETRVVELPLAERFTIATESWDAAHNVFVRVTSGEHWGVGEVQPAGRWDESVESVLEELNAVNLEALHGPFDLEGVQQLLPPGSARCALDMAFHDLAASIAGISVAEFLGLGGRSIQPTSVTVPIDSLDEMRARAEKLSDYPKLKMKVGFDDDVEAVAAVRDVYPGDIRIDANEGWSESEAIDRLAALAPFRIELCEQPIARNDLEALARVTEASEIPIYADEDAGTAEDVARLAVRVDGVNLKLRKSGGITEVVRAAAVARAHGMGLMLGCDLHSGVATTAGAHVAPLMDHIDLDGSLLLAEDPYPGVRYEGANLILPEGPGILGLGRSALEGLFS